MCEDNEAVIKMIIKGRSPTMRHVSRTHRVALDWLFDRINLDPKIRIKYIDTKNQLADILTKGNFTRDEWNHLLTLFNISHFSSTTCTAAMAKRAQQESREERVTAKSRPMMNLTARMPSVVSSSTSSNPVMISYGYQDPGKSVASDDRSGQPENSSLAGYSKEDYGRSWSSQEWKSGAAEHDRSGKPETTSWDILQKIAPHREEPLLGGNAHSARYGELIHDRTEKPDGYMWSGERLTRNQLTSRPDHLWPELWMSMGKHAKLKEKQKWSEEKLHLENARKLRGIYFIDPEDTEFKETPSRTRVRSWKHQWLLLCPVKIMKIVGAGHPTKLRQNLRVFWKLMNPQECVWEIRYRIIMKTILQENVRIHHSTTNLFLCLKL